MSYSYKIYGNVRREQEARSQTLYTRDELNEMTTFQLRNICYKEKLVESLTHTMDREELIRTILKFRSAEESLLIHEYKQGGLERIEAVLGKYLRTQLSDDGSIQVPAKIILYQGLRVDQMDQYRVEAPALGESNVLIVNGNLEVCAILHLVKDEKQRGVFYLTTESEIELRKTANKQYSFLFFRKQDSEYLYKAYTQDKPLPPVNLHFYKVPIHDLEIRELEETQTVLAIDFGTSNTTAGAYLDSRYVEQVCTNGVLNGRIRLNQINYVKFPDTTHKTKDWIELLPTVVSVTDCSDSKQIRYAFGFEAMNYMKKNGYSTTATVCHAIKRWVNSHTKVEELTDGQGNSAVVQRGDVLRAYLLHVIRTAEQQFKCRFKALHISSPVKLKTQTLEVLTAILPEYHIEAQNALDEGMAVLYNTIAEQIEKNSFTDGREYKALVIDCGGGTTDLSSCRFRIENGSISYKVDIQTTYENGDTNFGGNNITYRIMQFMKIVFAEYYRNKGAVIDIDSLIDIPGNDIFRHVDEYGVHAVYEQFEARYREAEAVVPTRFSEYENRTRDEYQRVKSNFYFLWEIAENMKKEFFRKTGILRNRFHSESEKSRENDLKITAIDRWCLSLLEGGRFQAVYELPEVVFNIKEINHLIKADIYETVRKFLDEFYQQGKLQEYSIIKLTGQSCRIDVFREALKEFVPGRSIEFKQKSEEDGKVPDLKLACLRGVIRYLSAQKMGYIVADITNHDPAVPYSVSAYTHTRDEVLLISSYERLNRIYGTISRPTGVAEVEFMLRGSDGKVRHTYNYRNEERNYTRVLYQDIYNQYGEKIPQEDTDSIVNGEVKFFVFAGENNWGFHVVPISRKNEQLYMGNRRFYAFETDLSELDFFDGLK
ncbi:molecular chaperone [Paenibacillus turpanensis]|uniref:molecular chaperone n=1 Tax=Paenibacillus turpanensis TaxID=2689078 RepID=UPI001409DFCD|nr:molecular chaperone [Paenibacillus turpanensis]